MLIALPSEAPRLAEYLARAKIPIKRTALNPKRRHSVAAHVAALVAKRPEVAALAKKCFSSYVRSVCLAGDKACFDPNALPLKAYATSLGLSSAPRVKLPSDSAAARETSHVAKNANRKLARLKEQIAEAKAAKRGGAAAPKAAPKAAPAAASDSSDDDDDADPLVRKQTERDIDAIVVPDAPDSRKQRKVKRQKIDGAGTAFATGAAPTRTTFDDDGAAADDRPRISRDAPAARGDALVAANEAFIARARDRLAKTDAEDRAREKERRKALKRARKGPKKEHTAAPALATLASDSD